MSGPNDRYTIISVSGAYGLTDGTKRHGPVTWDEAVIMREWLNAAYAAGREGADDRIAALEKALKWALPLAELATETCRLERVRCGHNNIRGTYKNGTTWVGIWQDEIDNIETARSLLAPQTDKDQT